MDGFLGNTMYLKRLLLRMILFFKGVRFYETTAVPKSPEFRKVEIRLVNGHRVEFYFYKEHCEDLIFRYNKISRETFYGYVIQARFCDNLPEVLYRYNNVKFFFNPKAIFGFNEEILTEVLLEIYLNFIKEEIKQSTLA